MALASASRNSDPVSSLYNGYVYPMEQYNNERTVGYTVETGYDINPISGNLTVVENDLSLKGINGLDLNLNRVYSSERSNMMEASAYLHDETTSIQKSYYMVRANAKIEVTYAEADSNGGKNNTVTKQESAVLTPKRTGSRGQGVYTPVSLTYVNQQIKDGIVSSLCKSQEEANDLMNKGYEGYYDKTIKFATGKISEINISIYNNTDNIYLINKTVTPSQIPYYTTSSYWDATYTLKRPKSFSDLGCGWEFDFPYIEIKEEPYTDSYGDFCEEIYEYLHYGTRGTWYFDEGDTSSNLSGYLLDDMKLTRYRSTFDSRSTGYLLEEADGKKSYFGTKGELLGIEDRFGNKIRFYYTKISDKSSDNPVLTKISIQWAGKSYLIIAGVKLIQLIVTLKETLTTHGNLLM